MQPLELIIVNPGIPLALCFQCVCAHGNPILPVVKVVGALGVFFFLAPDDAAIGLDFAVRIKRSLAITPRAVCELEVLVQREFGLSHKNLLAG